MKPTGIKAPLILIVLVLAVTALGLAFLIFRQYAPKSSSTKADQNAVGTPSAAPSTDEQKVLNPPVKGSEADQKQFADLITKLAKDSTTLNISGCRPQPLVMRIKKGATFKLNNTDSQAHVLTVDKDHTYTVSPSASVDVVADFGRGPGIYGFGCDKSGGPVGMLLVTE